MNTLIEKDNYHTYFDSFSKLLPNELVEIEVVGINLGDQIEANFVVLTGMTYEPKSHELYLYLSDELEHVITSPVEVYVSEDENGVNEIAVKCAQGHLHLIKFKHAVALPK